MFNSARRCGTLSVALCVLSLASNQSFAQSQPDIAAQIAAQIPDNGRGAITASGLRGVLNSLNSATSNVAATINSQRGAPNGFATLDNGGFLPGAQIPGMNALGATIYRFPSSHFADSVSIRDFGAKGDNATDSTFAVQQAVNAASGLGQTLAVPASVDGGGVYRIGPNMDWKNVNLRFDEGAKFVNLDGSAYTGAFYAGFNGLPGVFDPAIVAKGRRVSAPGRDTIFLNAPGDNHESFQVYNGTAAFPYDVNSGERSYFLSGQAAPSSGSWAGLGVFANIYNHSNGPGFNITCTATNGSATLTACSPSPTASHTFTDANGGTRSVGNVFSPARLTSTTPGIPVGAYAGGWDASTISLAAAGTFYTPAPYTGTTGQITVNVVSGRSEFNTNSFQINPIGNTGAGGPAGGMNWYPADIVTGTNISTNPADQEGFLAGLQVGARKQVPGNAKDVLHNGSYILPVYSIPNTGVATYPMDAGIAVTGWSGPAGTGNGNAPGATPFANVGVDVGTGCSSVYCFFNSPSYVKTAFQAQGYDTGMIFANPHPNTFSGTAIYLAPGAGNIDLRDSLYVGGRIREFNSGTPASATAACTTGDRTWDVNYEYRCVGTNTWKRAALSTW